MQYLERLRLLGIARAMTFFRRFVLAPGNPASLSQPIELFANRLLTPSMSSHSTAEMSTKIKVKSEILGGMSPDDGAYGRLAEVVRVLLDESCIGGQQSFESLRSTRSSWADILGVSRAALSQWVTGRTVPSAEHFRSIIDVLEGQDDSPDLANARALDCLYKIIDEPLSLLMFAPHVRIASPSGRRAITGTLGDYIAAPAREALGRRITSVLSRMRYAEQLGCMSELSELLDILETESASGSRPTRGSQHVVGRVAQRRAMPRVMRQQRGLVETSKARSKLAA